VAAFLDAQKFPGIMGTIAGDDTIFIAPQDTLNVLKLRQEIEKALE
jgi:arginine repressor